MYLEFYFSGLLTGRFKPAEVLDSSKTRIGLLDKIGAMGTSFPEWRDYCNNDTYWNIIEELSNIAKSNGTQTLKAAMTTHVAHLCRLVKCYRILLAKHCRLRLELYSRPWGSLILAHHISLLSHYYLTHEPSAQVS